MDDPAEHYLPEDLQTGLACRFPVPELLACKAYHEKLSVYSSSFHPFFQSPRSVELHTLHGPQEILVMPGFPEVGDFLFPRIIVSW